LAPDPEKPKPRIACVVSTPGRAAAKRSNAHRLQRARRGGVGGQLEAGHEIALVLFGQERGGQVDEADDEQSGNQGNPGHHPPAAPEQPGHPVWHDAVSASNPRSKTRKTRAFARSPNRPEQAGAQGRGQAQRQKGREQDRDRHRHRELAIDRADRARRQRHRNEHRRQDQRDADDRGRDLVHRLHGRIAGDKCSSCISRSTFSTTTIASSTMMPIASTMPNIVSTLTE
jgi:hypothetical protein